MIWQLLTINDVKSEYEKPVLVSPELPPLIYRPEHYKPLKDRDENEMYDLLWNMALWDLEKNPANKTAQERLIALYNDKLVYVLYESGNLYNGFPTMIMVMPTIPDGISREMWMETTGRKMLEGIKNRES